MRGVGDLPYRPAMAFPLPDGLPPGHLESWGTVDVWLSNELPQDIEHLWRLLLDQSHATGLFPLLCWPDSQGQPHDLAGVDAIRLESKLAADFLEYRRQRLPFWSQPMPMEMPEDVEPWPHDPGPPFVSWPGLAPSSPVTADSSIPTQTAARTVAGLVDTHWYGLNECRLALVPAQRGADIPAVLGWKADAPIELLCALLRSWEERFGAQVVAMFGSELHVAVAWPPRSADQAELLALEHVLSTADNIVDDPPTPFPDYAGRLVNRTHWWFGWD
ncbi:hypothetical protein Kpho02_19400 [Kitasatospora phosalacinea]|uniref:DUF4253 domain-containing protein n=2 Tax=Kitasatospora phosalacinea TaxID=2065 RepID=A0A9W6Q6F5_9ACTN|nr:hypothetical protein Kpho02_19400 [Kitasatospora phosalacinea]